MIIPRRRKAEVGLLFSQYKDGAVGMADLDQFKRFGPAATPAVTIQVFPDFEETKDLSLLLVHFKPSDMSREDALRLVQCLLQVYRAQTDWVQCFNETPMAFDVNSFLEHCPG